MTFKKEFAKCSKCDCGQQRLIVNRTRWLCDEKNKERLEEFKSNKKSSNSGLNRFSSKRVKIESDYIKVTNELKNDIDNFKCKCCGTNESLSFSHLVPRSRRSDLIAKKINIVIHCIGENNCHQRWESQDVNMKDYESNMNIVKELDPEYYNLLLMKNGAS